MHLSDCNNYRPSQDTRQLMSDNRADLQHDVLDANKMNIVRLVEEAFEEVSTPREVSDMQEDIQTTNQDQDIYLSVDSSQCQSNFCDIEWPDLPALSINHVQDNYKQPPSSGFKNRRRKVPSWKLPPVPILPKECYSSKALLAVSCFIQELLIRITDFALISRLGRPASFISASSNKSSPASSPSNYLRFVHRQIHVA